MHNDTLIIVLFTNHFNLLLLLARLLYYIHLYYVKCHLDFACSVYMHVFLILLNLYSVKWDNPWKCKKYNKQYLAAYREKYI